jgi:hypothetical protein
MLNLELCMLTWSHAHHGAFHGHLGDMKAHLKTLRLTLKPCMLTHEPCMFTRGHRFNRELDLQSLFGLLCSSAVLIG